MHYYLVMANSIAPLVEKLIEKQGELTDAKFSEKLGISINTWRCYRQGTRNPGPVLFGAVLKTFPELSDAINSYIVSRLNGRN